MNRILILDDEPGIVQALRRLLRLVPCTCGNEVFDLEVESFTSAHQALKRAQSVGFDLFLTDYRMPEMDGVSFLKATKALQPDSSRLILSGYADLDALMRAVNEVGLDRFIGKPWNDYDVVAAIGQSLARRALLLENRRLADLMRVEFGDLTPAQIETTRLERLEPGITKVSWGDDGSVMIESDEAS
jgi:two-component system, probable response regulator PhcQ